MKKRQAIRIGLAAATTALWGTGAASEGRAQPFYSVQGTQIVDSTGAPAVVRGVGLGGWLMPEGYMLGTGGGPSALRARTEGLVGVADSDAFWSAYRQYYVAEKDVEAIVEWGFDHIRLPFHYNVFYDLDTGTFKEDGFALLDDFLGWCGSRGIGVILDMHAAPGAQSDGDIADSDGEARLWTEPVPYQDLTEDIWVEIATRYADDPRIIGYDLINEPVTPSSIPDGAQALRDLYGRLTDAIRAVDPNHILFIEGNFFATTFDKLTPPFDDNMVYAFHKYWSVPTIGTIQYLLNIRDEHQVPLWLGETGENSNTWFHQVVRLAEDNGIGWNFWTHKKLRTTTSPVSAPIKPGYQAILDHWNSGASAPSPTAAREALMNMAVGLDLDSTDARPGVLAALFESDYGSGQRPFAEHRLPGTVVAAHYDIGPQGVAYFDSDYWAVSGAPGGGNNGASYRNDGVDIEPSTDVLGFEFNVGWLESLEWTEYTVQVDSTAMYSATLRVASLPGGGDVSLFMDNVSLGSATIPQTGGWQNWTTVSIGPFPLEAGERILKLSVGRTGDFNVNTISFVVVGPTSTDPTAAPDSPSLTVFPNPASDRVSAEYVTRASGDAELIVYDMLGRIVRRIVAPGGPGTHRIDLDVRSLPPGVYSARLVLIEAAAPTFHDRTFLVIR